MTEPCPHPGFRAEVDVIWMPDVAAWTADVRIRCEACAEPFTFVGVEAGLSSDGPRVSVQGTELHVPIRPESARMGPMHRWGFTIRPVEVKPGTEPSPASTDATDRLS